MKGNFRKLAVLASGSGTTLQAIINAIQSKDLDATIEIVVSDQEDAFALTRANTTGIRTYVLRSSTAIARDEELLKVLKEADVDIVVLAGYLKLVGPKTVNNFVIINTHPSLIPKYCGKGMHGMHVHEAVVANHEKETGVTLHFVNENYDEGQIIWQTHVPVFPEDDADAVSARVQAAEKTQLVSMLKAFSEGKINVP